MELSLLLQKQIEVNQFSVKPICVIFTYLQHIYRMLFTSEGMTSFSQARLTKIKVASTRQVALNLGLRKYLLWEKLTFVTSCNTPVVRGLLINVFCTYTFEIFSTCQTVFSQNFVSRPRYVVY